MRRSPGIVGLPAMLAAKPLQGSKFLGIVLTFVLGFSGFFRLIDATALIGDPLLGDGQFLTLLLIPLLSLGLVGIVFVETLVGGYRVFRSDASLDEQLAGRTGYVVIRCVEAAIALIGVTIIVTALPSLFAEATPAPAGVGILLLLMAVGVGILFMSFVRSGAELFVYTGTP